MKTLLFAVVSLALFSALAAAVEIPYEKPAAVDVSDEAATAKLGCHSSALCVQILKDSGEKGWQLAITCDSNKAANAYEVQSGDKGKVISFNNLKGNYDNCKVSVGGSSPTTIKLSDYFKDGGTAQELSTVYIKPDTLRMYYGTSGQSSADILAPGEKVNLYVEFNADAVKDKKTVRLEAGFYGDDDDKIPPVKEKKIHWIHYDANVRKSGNTYFALLSSFFVPEDKLSTVYTNTRVFVNPVSADGKKLLPGSSKPVTVTYSNQQLGKSFEYGDGRVLLALNKPLQLNTIYAGQKLTLKLVFASASNKKKGLESIRHSAIQVLNPRFTDRSDNLVDCFIGFTRELHVYEKAGDCSYNKKYAPIKLTRLSSNYCSGKSFWTGGCDYAEEVYRIEQLS